MWDRIHSAATRMASGARPVAGSEAVRRGMARGARIGGALGRGLWGILWRRKLLVLACVIVALGLTMAHIARLAPTFEAESLVMLEDRGASPELVAGEPGRATPSEAPDLADQSRLIESRTMAERLVDRLGLQLVAEFNPLLHSASADGSKRRDLPRSVPGALLDRLARGWADTLAIGASDGQLTDQQQAARLRDHVVHAAMARVEADPAPPATLSLKFVSADPNLAAAGANALAHLYLEDRRGAGQEARQREHERLKHEIERLAKSIAASEKAIEELRAGPAAGSGQPSEQNLLGLTGELAFWSSERAKIEARLGQVRGPLGTEASLGQAAAPSDSTPLGDLGAREAELEREIAELSQANGQEDPQIAPLQAELVSLEDQKRFAIEQTAAQLEREMEIIRSREMALAAQIETLEGQLAESPAADGPETLEQQVEADRELLRTYVDRAAHLEAPQTAPAPDAHIVFAADAPTEPKYPRRALIYASSLGGGLLLGGLLALALEALHRVRA
jgi:succinoglycan biosynthesis transport protein ExoP